MFRTALRKPLSSVNIRGFHAGIPAFIQAGSAFPAATLLEESPGNSVDLSEELKKGKNLVVGVPGAFSPACSASHVPGYIKAADKLHEKGIDNVFIVAVNDPFVMKAWKEDLKAPKSFRFLSDVDASLAKKLDVVLDAKKVFGNERNKRYAAVVENGNITKAFEEPDGTGVNVSAAENVLKQI